jgi:hypothetical protein
MEKSVKKHSPQSTRRILKRILNAPRDRPPILEGMEFVRFVKETVVGVFGIPLPFEADFAWAVYISHDPCHDHDDFVADRNTVIAIHRLNGTFRILGRELDRKFALRLARGLV